ncbi:hypothetical protein M8C21_013674 [Ambrosia artemisiifolia]|uniref:Uncharacterized protein n=1 Tax=Ambrosia artemisiifolia TaxID=4212 RepID=A0AAD5GUC3_AMBAR|nr:hypothetical protein M8C21_013674 [Ambrosia artemisiifolia]
MVPSGSGALGIPAVFRISFTFVLSFSVLQEEEGEMHFKSLKKEWQGGK